MFFRLLAEDAELYQEFLKRLIRPGVRRKSLHLRENAIEGIWLEITPQGLQNNPHVAAGHKGVPAGVAHANLPRGGIHKKKNRRVERRSWGNFRRPIPQDYTSFVIQEGRRFPVEGVKKSNPISQMGNQNFPANIPSKPHPPNKQTKQK